MTERKYKFSWDLLGDLETGRPNMGPNVRLEIYRIMQFCFRDILEQRYGTKEVDEIFRDAGELAGMEFYKNVIAPRNPEDFAAMIRIAEETLREYGLGIMRVEKAEMDDLNFTIAISEDLDCSGLPELNFETCVYDEGFLGGILKANTGRDFKVREVDCWCTGDRTCRFEAKVK